jgi:hypothetical protein
VCVWSVCVYLCVCACVLIDKCVGVYVCVRVSVCMCTSARVSKRGRENCSCSDLRPMLGVVIH